MKIYMRHMSWDKHSKRLKTFAIAVLGVFVFKALDLPLPFLFGPMFGCLAAALLGVQLQSFGVISTCARTILGVAIGAAITPAFFQQLLHLGLSIVIIPLYLLLIAFAAVPFFRYFFKFDAVTSYYAAMPGGLQDMVVFGMEAGADPRALSLIQATRVFIIITLAPFILVQYFGMSLDQPMGAPARDIPVFELILMVFAGIIGWKLAQKIGLFGASILGPLILTAILSMLNLIHMRPPQEAILTAQFFIGIAVGVHFVGITLKEIRKYVLAGVVYTCIISLIALAIALFIANTGIAEPQAAFLAFSPGGQAEMTMLAIISGVDLGYVISHHITRLVLVILGAPLCAKFFTRSKLQD